MADRDGVRGQKCHSCGAIKAIAPGADLHCDQQCREDYATAVEQAAIALTAEGFSRDTAIPNLFVKGGVAVSLEQVIREGLESTLAAHNTAVAILSTR